MCRNCSKFTFQCFCRYVFTSKVISLSMREQWKELLPVLTISVSMGIFIYGVGLLIDNAYAKVAIEIPIAVLLYWQDYSYLNLEKVLYW